MKNYSKKEYVKNLNIVIHVSDYNASNITYADLICPICNRKHPVYSYAEYPSNSEIFLFGGLACEKQKWVKVLEKFSKDCPDEYIKMCSITSMIVDDELLKQKAYEKYEYKCSRCNRVTDVGSLKVAYEDPESKYENKVANMELLCDECLKKENSL